ITEYADRLLEDLDGLDWPDSIKKLQTDWIGKKEGTKVSFEVRGVNQNIEVFTSRVDTIFGVSALVLAPEHSAINNIVTPAQEPAVKQYITEALNKADLDRELAATQTKTGVFTGAYALNPITNEEVPIWVADYVLGNVGTGAIMAVPAHDERDYDFAKIYDLPIEPVVIPEDKADRGEDYTDLTAIDVKLPFSDEGILIDSGSFTGLHTDEAKKAILNYLERRGEAEKTYSYKLRDWIFSRQRYWGEPIPLVHCSSCGIVPIPESELPLLLPEVEKYEPTGTGESPLASIEEWVNTKCPKCNGQAKRETNTMPQWAGSCWYYLRYIDPNNDKEAWSKDKEKAWMPVDVYV
ncbi:MAG TPA: leucine--tRNA ligase, partial [Flavobacterium sp.]|nr:leucine--tRNA ligase [Flavobacterium sp.]